MSTHVAPPPTHKVDYDVSVSSELWGLRDQICTTQGPQANRVRQVDFWRLGDLQVFHQLAALPRRERREPP